MSRALSRAAAALLILCRPGNGTLTTPATQSRETGRIEGLASIATSLSVPRPRVRVYDEPGSPPAKLHREPYPLANVVLYLESTPTLRQAAPPTSAARSPELRQSGERFVPHVLPVQAGTTVQFPNDDPLFHNVFSLSRVKSFDLGRYPKGSTRAVTFGSAGVVPVFCHIHADMSAYIVVLDHPFFVTPDSAGRFALEGIPPGDYKLVAWHERIRPFTLPVHVEAGRTTTLDVRLPFADRPGH
jgi:plastocyanin